MDTARTAKRWEDNRFSTPKNKYLDALMHSAIGAGTSYFERPGFETSTTRVAWAKKHAPECYKDIAPSIKQVHEIVGEVTDQVFDHMDRLLGVKNFVGGNRKNQLRPITMHRVTPVDNLDTKKVAAQEHFDFTLCNVLLYNYVQGFKLYHGGEWYQLAEPPRPDMLLYNLGSCLSVRTSRRISSLFHRVDTPLKSQQAEPRLSLVYVFIPAFAERLEAHPKLIRPDDPTFGPHTYAEHVFYASDNYTKLNKHVIFEGNCNVREPGIRFCRQETALTALQVSPPAARGLASWSWLVAVVIVIAGAIFAHAAS